MKTLPEPERNPDWRMHFEWLTKQKVKGGGFVEELNEDRRRQRVREAAMEEAVYDFSPIPAVVGSINISRYRI